MTGPPADDVTAQTRLGENIPKRFAFARSAGVGPRAAVYRVRLDEAVDAVLVGEFSGSDGIPEHRRENRLKRREIAHHPAVDQALEARHQPFFEERSNHLPIRCIPTNQEVLFRFDDASGMEGKSVEAAVSAANR